jgi:RNA polymerase sigma-70 factor (ECF subfamily)
MARPADASSDPRSDESLVEGMNQGDASAFDALYARHKDWVFRLAWRFTADPHDALDVLQETFIYLLGKCPGLRLNARLTTFLYPAVKHIALRLRDKRGRTVPDAGLESLEATEDANAGRGELAAVLAALPPPQRDIVLMRFVDDMSLQEIADALSVPLGTVKSRLHFALIALRDDPRARRYFDGPT